MSSGHMEFQTRVRRLLRKHTAMTRGYTTRMRPDGLMVAVPRRPPPPVSPRSVVMCLGVFILLKGVLIAALGPGDYERRVVRLAEGNFVQQAGAFAMKADPLTALVAVQLAPMMR
ncbi:hypothetical protein [Seohaeicola zhoushanensis]|uniref:Uncharacterized protein n=1 Tax=Seohaeicola zhoushanensis TaxID=1569283 RepID=A0A8J3MB16_9RHOB|nr:hypothetical protein [Seohaeicola zhoushanensis]GHF61605.1 hypothetical protein GCM10017056_36300 [Seohaeicola zhoushanensis]